MDTRLLRMFCVVAEFGSLVAASSVLHLTPSALSHGLKSLEAQLGCRLFERAGKKLLLNQAGEQLLAQIQAPLAALDAAEESLKRLSKWGQTRLRNGAAASACQHIVPGIIRELKKACPTVQLQVESGDMAEMIGMIHQNRIDLALGVAPESNSHLEIRPTFKDELLFTFAPSHNWRTAHSIPREQLRTQPLILYQRSSLTAQLIDKYFRDLDIVPSTIMEIANIEAIKELVKLNLGVAVLAPWTVDKELVRGSLCMRPLGAKPLRRQWAIVSMAGRRWNLAEETFSRLCGMVAAGLRMDRRDLPQADK
jgi:DNA-binding transcriptional LysR family regulator